MAGHAGTFLLLHFPGIVLGGREIGESRESGEQEGARANKRNDIILQAKGKTADETGDVGGPAGTRTGKRSHVRRLGDTYAIEIKPKQGWLQLASDVNDLFDLMPAGAETKPKEEPRNQEEREPSPRDKCWCRFCSMQLLKVSEWDDNEGHLGFFFLIHTHIHSLRQLHNGKIKRLGHYCPLDLFSGYVIEPRTPCTVHCALYTDWCPDNEQGTGAGGRSSGTNIES